MINYIYTLAILIVFMSPSFGLSAEKWDDLSETAWLETPEIELQKPLNANQLIAHYEFDDKQYVTSEIKTFLQTKYNPILAFIYLTESLYKEHPPENLVKSLEIFKESESDNALPEFLLSYSYILNSNFDQALYHLERANKKEIYNDYTSERKKITYEYLMSKTGNEILSYSNTIGIDQNIPSILFRMTRYTNKSSIENLNQELVNFSKTIEKHSSNAFQLQASIYSQLKCTDQTKHPNRFKLLTNKLSSTRKAGDNFVEAASNAAGKDNLITYLRLVYKYGEIEAIRLHFNINLREDNITSH